MTIRQLKEHIKDFPDETELLVYLRQSEDAGWLNQIEAPVAVKDANVHYCKGDSPVDPRYSKWSREHPDTSVAWLVGS